MPGHNLKRKSNYCFLTVDDCQVNPRLDKEVESPDKDGRLTNVWSSAGRLAGRPSPLQYIPNLPSLKLKVLLSSPLHTAMIISLIKACFAHWNSRETFTEVFALSLSLSEYIPSLRSEVEVPQILQPAQIYSSSRIRISHKNCLFKHSIEINQDWASDPRVIERVLEEETIIMNSLSSQGMSVSLQCCGCLLLRAKNSFCL